MNGIQSDDAFKRSFSLFISMSPPSPGRSIGSPPFLSIITLVVSNSEFEGIISPFFTGISNSISSIALP